MIYPRSHSQGIVEMELSLSPSGSRGPALSPHLKLPPSGNERPRDLPMTPAPPLPCSMPRCVVLTLLCSVSQARVETLCNRVSQHWKGPAQFLSRLVGQGQGGGWTWGSRDCNIRDSGSGEVRTQGGQGLHSRPFMGVQVTQHPREQSLAHLVGS